MDQQQPLTPEEQEEWRKVLLTGDPLSRWLKRLFRATPSAPRCKLCYAPFRGLGGKLLGFTGFAPSRKNPLFCKT